MHSNKPKRTTDDLTVVLTIGHSTHTVEEFAIPRLVVIRPCDGSETAYAWRVAIETQDRPVALVLTRQDVPPLDRSRGDAWRRDWPRPLCGASAPGTALMREYDR